jgi:hypothetical protein
VYVLARHTGYDHRVGWSFYVLSTARLVRIATPGGDVSLARLEAAGMEPVDVDGLPGAVTRASREGQ